MIYATEKSLKDLGDKVDAAEKQKIDDAIAALKQALSGDDVEAIKAKTKELQEASYKIAEELYKQQAAAGGNPDMGGANPEADAGASAGPNKGSADDVDYEVVDDDK